MELSTEALKKRLTELNMVISVRERKAKLLSKKWYDKKVKDAHLAPGQTVMVFDERVGNRQRDKLSQPWRGPYLLTKFKSARKVILRDPVLGNELECHVNRLRLLRDKEEGRYEVQEGTARSTYPDGRQHITSILGRAQDADGLWTYAVRENNQPDVSYLEEDDLPPMLRDLAVESWAEFERQQVIAPPEPDRAPNPPDVSHPGGSTADKMTTAGENHMSRLHHFAPSAEPRAVIMADPGSLLKRRRENDAIEDTTKRSRLTSSMPWAA